MREIHGQFSLVFRTRGGNKFNAELSNPYTSSSLDFRPWRLLTTTDKALVETGDVVTMRDVSLLVSLSTNLYQAKQFKCYDITHEFLWTRMSEKIDFVTGLPRDAQLVTLDAALPVVMGKGSITANMRVETDKYQILTGADVQVGDRIGSWIVQTRQETLGLKMLEVA